MKQVLAILAPLFFAAGGCISGPIPRDPAESNSAALSEPLALKEIVKLSRAGISEGVITGLIRVRGISERPDPWGILALQEKGVAEPVILVLLASSPNPALPKPALRMVYRELPIPLWPGYSLGRWHFGIRMTCMVRARAETPEALPERPEPLEVRPEVIDP